MINHHVILRSDKFDYFSSNRFVQVIDRIITNNKNEIIPKKITACLLPTLEMISFHWKVIGCCDFARNVIFDIDMMWSGLMWQRLLKLAHAVRILLVCKNFIVHWFQLNESEYQRKNIKGKVYLEDISPLKFVWVQWQLNYSNSWKLSM